MTTSGYTNTGPTPPPNAAEVWAACQSILDRYARDPARIDVFVMLREDAEKVKRTMPAAAVPASPLEYDRLAGIPFHVVDSLAEGRLLAAELRLAGKRVGLVGRLAPEG